MRLSKLLDILRDIAPESLAESWDKVGLHVGDPQSQVRRGLLCIDLTESVLSEAIASRVQLIIAYHPPIFSPLVALTTCDTKQRLILRAAQNKIAIYSPHTALDAAHGGVNDWLCHGIGKGDVVPIKSTQNTARRSYKLVTFVPHKHTDKVRTCMAAAGAGQIGNYTHCSFSSPGEGTFNGDDSTNPAIGDKGRLERVPELRLEMACTAGDLLAVITAMKSAHPYEEVAFDIYPLETDPSPSSDAGTGQGRVIELDRPVSHSTLTRRIKEHLGVKSLNVGIPKRSTLIKRVGICAGAGGSLLDPAGDIDAFVTGEMRHHDILAAVERGVCIYLAGHTETERPYLKVYKKMLTKACGRSMAWQVSRADTAPDARV